VKNASQFNNVNLTMSVENLLGTAVPCFKPSKGNPAKVLKSYSLVYAASGDKDIV
jgi:hypothetical protein